MTVLQGGVTILSGAQEESVAQHQPSHGWSIYSPLLSRPSSTPRALFILLSPLENEFLAHLFTMCINYSSKEKTWLYI